MNTNNQGFPLKPMSRVLSLDSSSKLTLLLLLLCWQIVMFILPCGSCCVNSFLRISFRVRFLIIAEPRGSNGMRGRNNVRPIHPCVLWPPVPQRALRREALANHAPGVSFRNHVSSGNQIISNIVENIVK